MVGLISVIKFSFRCPMCGSVVLELSALELDKVFILRRKTTSMIVLEVEIRDNWFLSTSYSKA